MKQNTPSNVFLTRRSGNTVCVRWAFLLLVMSGASWCVWGPMKMASAQVEEETLDEGLTEIDENPAGAPAVTDPPREERSLLDTLIDGGVVGLLILVLSMVAVGFGVEHSLTIRKSVLMPDFVIAELDELIRENRIDEAIEACNAPQNQSLVAYVVLEDWSDTRVRNLASPSTRPPWKRRAKTRPAGYTAKRRYWD